MKQPPQSVTSRSGDDGYGLGEQVLLPNRSAKHCSNVAYRQCGSPSPFPFIYIHQAPFCASASFSMETIAARAPTMISRSLMAEYREAAGAFAEALNAACDAISACPEVRTGLIACCRAITSSVAIIQSDANDVELIAEGCVERREGRCCGGGRRQRPGKEREL